MSVNENRITVTLQWFTDTLSRNSNFRATRVLLRASCKGILLQFFYPIVEGGDEEISTYP